MNLHITGTRMTSTDTTHHAERISARDETWRLSWLPGRLVSRNQATTGMVLAATLTGLSEAKPDAVTRMAIEARSGELGLTAQQAHHLITKGTTTNNEEGPQGHE